MIKIWENPNAKNYWVDQNGVGHMPEGIKCLESYFEGCNELTYIIIPKGVKKIASDAFFNCVNLKYVLLPEGVKEIGDFAFADCVNLKEINIPEKTKKIGHCAFFDCKSLESVIIPQNIKNLGENVFTGTKCGVIFKNITDNFGLATFSKALDGGEYKIEMENDSIVVTPKEDNEDTENV